MQVEIQRLHIGDEQLAIRAIRELTPKDERDGRERSMPTMQRFLGQATNFLILALSSDVPLGFLTAYSMPKASCDARMVYLFEINIAPDYWRQGIGKQLVNRLKAECANGDNGNIEEIWVGTENDNVAAKRLYESTGGICSYPDSCEFVYKIGWQH